MFVITCVIILLLLQAAVYNIVLILSFFTVRYNGVLII